MIASLLSVLFILRGIKLKHKVEPLPESTSALVFDLHMTMILNLNMLSVNILCGVSFLILPKQLINAMFFVVNVFFTCSSCEVLRRVIETFLKYWTELWSFFFISIQHCVWPSACIQQNPVNFSLHTKAIFSFAATSGSLPKKQSCHILTLNQVLKQFLFSKTNKHIAMCGRYIWNTCKSQSRHEQIFKSLPH